MLGSTTELEYSTKAPDQTAPSPEPEEDDAEAAQETKAPAPAKEQVRDEEEEEEDIFAQPKPKARASVFLRVCPFQRRNLLMGLRKEDSSSNNAHHLLPVLPTPGR